MRDASGLTAAQELTFSEHAKNVMFKIDALPPDIRAVVHEYGWTFVDQMRRAGISGSRQMRHIAQSVSAYRGSGNEIRDPPNEAEIAEAARILAAQYGRPKHRPTKADQEAARQVVGALWNRFHWGRCRCAK